MMKKLFNRLFKRPKSKVVELSDGRFVALVKGTLWGYNGVSGSGCIWHSAERIDDFCTFNYEQSAYNAIKGWEQNILKEIRTHL